MAGKRLHEKMVSLPPGFCAMHLKYVLSCSDPVIAAALAHVPKYDLERLRRILERT